MVTLSVPRVKVQFLCFLQDKAASRAREQNTLCRLCSALPYDKNTFVTIKFGIFLFLIGIFLDKTDFLICLLFLWLVFGFCI